MVYDQLFWNDFTYPSQPIACIIDEYRVDCSDWASKHYIKHVVSNTVEQNDALNKCTKYGIVSQHIEFDPINFVPNDEGAYTFKIRGYKTG